MIKQITKLSELQTWRAQQIDKKIALVPTMGALHAGHLSIIARAAALCDHVIVSIFVNPLQFAPNEDFDEYPRQLNTDLLQLEAFDNITVFTPEPNNMMNFIDQNDLTKNLILGHFNKILCAVSRPHFFGGVTKIVAALLSLTQADYAFFGMKDYQQLTIIKHMVKQLSFKTKIIGVPIYRDADGLATSSRNKYLDDKQRRLAKEIFATLYRCKHQLNNKYNLETCLANAHKHLDTIGFNVDYLELRNSNNLSLLDDNIKPSRLFIAAKLGKTRLIDNMSVTS